MIGGWGLVQNRRFLYSWFWCPTWQNPNQSILLSSETVTSNLTEAESIHTPGVCERFIVELSRNWINPSIRTVEHCWICFTVQLFTSWIRPSIWACGQSWICYSVQFTRSWIYWAIWTWEYLLNCYTVHFLRIRSYFKDEAIYTSSQTPKRKRFQRHFDQCIPIEEFANQNEPKRKRGRPKICCGKRAHKNQK